MVKSPSELWRTIPVALRRRIVEAYWLDKDLLTENDREGVLRESASRLKFRPEGLRQMPLDAKINALAILGRFSDIGSKVLLSCFHLSRQRPLMMAFLAQIDVPNEDGWIPDIKKVKDPGREKLSKAVDVLLSRFPREDVVLYLNTLFATDNTWTFLQSAVESLGPIDANALVSAPNTAVREEGVKDDARVEGDQHTTLDTVLIELAVASTLKIEGALTPEQLLDLVDEVIHLNPKRMQSNFHRGFLDALQGREPEWEPSGFNEERRLWYLSGVLLGVLRQAQREKVVKYCELRRDDVLKLVRRGDWRSSMVLPGLFEGLWEAGQHGVAATLVTPGMVALVGPPLAQSLLTKATRMLAVEKTPEADALIATLEKCFRENPHLKPPQEFLDDLERRRVHCLRLERKFLDAEKRLEAMLRKPEVKEKSALRSDLGLVKAGFRRYHDVAIPEKVSDREAFGASLRKGERDFQLSIESESGDTGRGHYCLGVLRLLEEKKDDAVTHLRRALSFFERDSNPASASSPITFCRGYLGALLLERLDTDQVNEGIGYLISAIETDARLPLDVLKTALSAASVCNEEHSQRLGEVLFKKRGDDIIDLVVDAGLAESVSGILVALLERAKAESRPKEKRWRDWKLILHASLKKQDLGLARECLDQMEGMSDKPERARLFLEMLDDDANYDPAWTADEADWARARLLQLIGDCERVSGALTPIFHRTLARGGYGSTIEAESILEELVSCGTAENDLSPLQARLTAAKKITEVTTSRVVEGKHFGKVLFVGGNETQERYDQELLKAFSVEYPGAQIEFMHTGWTSNWGVLLERVRQRLPGVDVVVIMTFVRTLFGQGVRTACSEASKRWVPCTGHGRGAIERSLREAIHFLPKRS